MNNLTEEELTKLMDEEDLCNYPTIYKQLTIKDIFDRYGDYFTRKEYEELTKIASNR
jgi:hypothetical protein